MNGENQTNANVAAYCQNCGRPLSPEAVRSINGVIYCESCLAAKLGIGGSAPGAAAGTAYTVSGNAGGVNYTVSGVEPPPGQGPNPGLAALLGFIPGVGAMYNGQFIKALVHVLVFVILVGITNHHDIFGFFIPAWILYQVFDAYQTAKARRLGLPLPDPFGLNDLSQKMGIPGQQTVYTPPVVPPAQAVYDAPPVPPQAAAYGEYIPVPPVPPVPPIPPLPPDTYGRRNEPVGAIVLIVVGMLFLFSTLHIFSIDWVSKGWPVIVIVIGVWLLIRRTREIPPPPPAGGMQ